MIDKFTLEFSLADFNPLYDTSCKSFFSEQVDRFEIHDAKELPSYVDDGFFMYWTKGNDLQALVAEKILRAAGFKVVRLWDLNEPGWCMLTDYQSEAWTDD